MICSCCGSKPSSLGAPIIHSEGCCNAPGQRLRLRPEQEAMCSTAGVQGQRTFTYTSSEHRPGLGTPTEAATLVEPTSPGVAPAPVKLKGYENWKHVYPATREEAKKLISEFDDCKNDDSGQFVTCINLSPHNGDPYNQTVVVVPQEPSAPADWDGTGRVPGLEKLAHVYPSTVAQAEELAAKYTDRQQRNGFWIVWRGNHVDKTVIVLPKERMVSLSFTLYDEDKSPLEDMVENAKSYYAFASEPLVLRREVPDTDLWWLKLAQVTAEKSKDPSRQVGCILVHPDLNVQRSGGYNGMLMGVTETDAMWTKPNKYSYVCHAEFNAVALAARCGQVTEGCTAYITCYPCMGCARLLVQAGIKRIVCPAGEVANGYAHEREMTAELLAAAGIPVQYRPR